MVRKNVTSNIEQNTSGDLFADTESGKSWIHKFTPKWPSYYNDDDLKQMSEELIYSLIIDDLDETITHENKMILTHWRCMSDENQKTYQDFVKILVNLDKFSEENTYKVEESLVTYKLSDHSKSKQSSNRIFWIIVAVSLSFFFSLVYYFLA